MEASPDLFRPLAGAVRTAHGLEFLNRGDELPEDLLPEERERLAGLDAIGTPPTIGAAAPGQDAQARIDIFTSQRHYFDHVRPLAEKLGVPVQISEPLSRQLGEGVIGGCPVAPYHRRPEQWNEAVLVMGPRDIRQASALGWRRIAYLCHGVGQDYDRLLAATAPGEKIPWDRVEVVLLPSEFAAERFAPLCPEAEKLVVGQPKLDALQALPPPKSRCAALSFRWPHSRAPESRGALDHFRSVLPDLLRQLNDQGVELIGHGHPRLWPELMPAYRSAGIEPVRDFAEVCRRASAYACDNSSTLFEFAALGRPVVVLNAPWYRRDVEHGGRFWEWADVGEQVDEPQQLAGALARALESPESGAERRQEVVAEALPLADGEACERAAEALRLRFPRPDLEAAPAEPLSGPEDAEEAEGEAEGELDTFVATATVEQVLAQALDATRAQQLLDAELAVRGEEGARSTLLAELEKRGAQQPAPA